MTVKEFLDHAELRLGQKVALQYYTSGGHWQPITHLDDLVKPDSMTYYFKLVKQDLYVTAIARWQLQQLPGCCAFMVSTGAMVSDPYRRQGIGTLTNQFRQSLAKHLGYSALICTDVDDNEGERKILAKEGWKDIFQIVNRRTSNTVNISVKEL